MTNIPRVADLLRDPAIRESYRRVRKMRPGRGRRPSIKSLVFHDVVQTGDVIGRGPDGEFFLLITVSQRSFAWLCSADAFDDREEDNVDQGEDELPSGHVATGDADDAEEDDAPEEDDHAGGNIEDVPHDADDPAEQDDDAGDPSGRRTPREETRLQAARARARLQIDQPRCLGAVEVTTVRWDGQTRITMERPVPANLAPEVTA